MNTIEIIQPMPHRQPVPTEICPDCGFYVHGLPTDSEYFCPRCDESGVYFDDEDEDEDMDQLVFADSQAQLDSLRAAVAPNATARAIQMLTEACTVAGLVDADVYPAEPASTYDGAQVQIGTSTVNYFQRDDEQGNPWCIEITYENGTYDVVDDIADIALFDKLRELHASAGGAA